MSILSAVLLGLIQGISEFLPISSSGHLAIFQNFFGLTPADQQNLFFDVLLHLGTLLAVFVAYWADIKDIVNSFLALFNKERDRNRNDNAGKAARLRQRGDQRTLLLIIIATLPLFLILPVKDYIDKLYYNTFFIGFALIVTGALLFFSDRVRRGSKSEMSVRISDALVIGCAQALATTPGLSRSGTTISAGLFCGLDRQYAVKFSFLMSIPAVLGANLLSLIDAVKTGIDWSCMPAYLIGVFVAAVSGYLSIRFLRFLTTRGGFRGFAWYCWGAGVVTIILSLIK